MEYYNIDDYILKYKPEAIDFEIIEKYDRDGRVFIIKYTKVTKSLFGKVKSTLCTLCKAEGYSQGFDWVTCEFTTKEACEKLINKLCAPSISSTVWSSRKNINYGE